MKTTNDLTTPPELEKMLPAYKMVIPCEVESKIRYLQNKYPDTEWSGVLFFGRAGTFEAGDLTITCKDIYPMDLGDSTYTEFFMSEDVAGYMAQNIELFDCDLGLVHSHHAMKAFFSTTDLATLLSEGSGRNCFVSLIVNNEGTYQAAITRKIQVTANIQEQSKYSFFDADKAIELPIESKTESREVIQYFMLDIEKEEVESPYGDIDRRFEEINLKKRKKKHEYGITTHKSISRIPANPSCNLVQQSLFNENLVTLSDDENCDMLLVNDIICRVLTCSLMASPERFNCKQWVRRKMPAMYERTFGPDGAESASFQNYASWIIDYVINYMIDFQLEVEEYEQIIGEIIEAFKSLPSNDYIHYYISLLNMYTNEQS